VNMVLKSEPVALDHVNKVVHRSIIAHVDISVVYSVLTQHCLAYIRVEIRKCYLEHGRTRKCGGSVERVSTLAHSKRL